MDLYNNNFPSELLPTPYMDFKGDVGLSQLNNEKNMAKLYINKERELDRAIQSYNIGEFENRKRQLIDESKNKMMRSTDLYPPYIPYMPFIPDILYNQPQEPLIYELSLSILKFTNIITLYSPIQFSFFINI